MRRSSSSQLWKHQWDSSEAAETGHKTLHVQHPSDTSEDHTELDCQRDHKSDRSQFAKSMLGAQRFWYPELASRTRKEQRSRAFSREPSEAFVGWHWWKRWRDVPQTCLSVCRSHTPGGAWTRKRSTGKYCCTVCCQTRGSCTSLVNSRPSPMNWKHLSLISGTHSRLGLPTRRT